MVGVVLDVQQSSHYYSIGVLFLVLCCLIARKPHHSFHKCKFRAPFRISRSPMVLTPSSGRHYNINGGPTSLKLHDPSETTLLKATKPQVTFLSFSILPAPPSMLCTSCTSTIGMLVEPVILSAYSPPYSPGYDVVAIAPSAAMAICRELVLNEVSAV
jgi:hypothetical protein